MRSAHRYTAEFSNLKLNFPWFQEASNICPGVQAAAVARRKKQG
ncbi:MAG: hypothetical protein WBQ08_06530 [Candidatus Sulfotelmatobacter sp.]